jgi:phage shock protein A
MERMWERFGNPRQKSPDRDTFNNVSPMLPRPMGFFDRLSRLLRANLNDLVSKAEDPAKILDQSLADMQADLVKLRQAVATAIASQRRLQNQSEQADTQSKAWYQRAEVALQKGEESLAREALSRRKTYQDTATALNNQINSQAGQVETLKKSLTALEAKIAEAKTRKDMLKARAQAAQAQEQLQTAVNSLGTNNAMAAFEQMEEKVLSLEARSQAAAELAGADLESQFAALESSDVDDELAALKQRMEGGVNPIQLPAPNGPVPQLEPAQVAEVDAELQELKRSIDKL